MFFIFKQKLSSNMYTIVTKVKNKNVFFPKLLYRKEKLPLLIIHSHQKATGVFFPLWGFLTNESFSPLPFSFSLFRVIVFAFTTLTHKNYQQRKPFIKDHLYYYFFVICYLVWWNYHTVLRLTSIAYDKSYVLKMSTVIFKN